MNSISAFDELDQAIDAMLAGPEAQTSGLRPEVADLVGIARDLRHLPRPDFKTSLMVELEWEAAGRSISAAPEVSRNHRPIKSDDGLTRTLFAGSRSLYPVRSINLAASVGLHAALLFFMGMGFVWVKSTTRVVDLTVSDATRIEPYPFPAPASTAHTGGGGGGAADLARASQGAAPRFTRQQLTPPVVLPQNTPRIVVEATIVGPPDLNLPILRRAGDPLSRLLVPSAGVGVRGGIGDNDGGGVGNGNGNGLGPGRDGGLGGGVYDGGGVSAPRAIYKPEPDYSDEARKVGFQGVVVLWAVIGADGRPAKLGVARSLGMGLDEKALAAVNQWRFEPARKEGRAVPARIYVEVDFHLF